MPKTRSATETKALAKEYVQQLEPQSTGAVVLALCGDLGAGKTTFIQGMAKALDLDHRDVTSPTFLIIKKHRIKKIGRGFKRLIHIDCYRLNQVSEIANLGWSEIIAEPNNLVVIEWPDRIMSLLPKDTQMIRMTWLNDKEREIIYDQG